MALVESSELAEYIASSLEGGGRGGLVILYIRAERATRPSVVELGAEDDGRVSGCQAQSKAEAKESKLQQRPPPYIDERTSSLVTESLVSRLLG